MRLRAKAVEFYALSLLPVALTLCVSAHAQDSTSPIYVKQVATGRLEGIKNSIELSVQACRSSKKLPLNAPIAMPPDSYLEKLLLVENEEYFDRANYAKYSTSRRVAANPNSADCKLMLFHRRHVWAGEVCASSGTGGGTTPITDLTDFENPKPPAVTWLNEPASRAGCGKKAKSYDIQGLPIEDAGGARCVWQSDILAKSMRAAGLRAEGHKKDGKAADFCLYEKQPLYVHNGHHELVVLKSSGSTKDDVIDELTGESTAHLNHRLAAFSDGTPISADRFSRSAVQAFLSQPAITPVGVQ